MGKIRHFFDTVSGCTVKVIVIGALVVGGFFLWQGWGYKSCQGEKRAIVEKMAAEKNVELPKDKLKKYKGLVKPEEYKAFLADIKADFKVDLTEAELNSGFEGLKKFADGIMGELDVAEEQSSTKQNIK